jgi:hypothetical protein
MVLQQELGRNFRVQTYYKNQLQCLLKLYLSLVFHPHIVNTINPMAVDSQHNHFRTRIKPISYINTCEETKKNITADVHKLKHKQGEI